MKTFLFGFIVLFLGYIFYSKYVEKQFGINNDETPALKINDGQDFVPLNAGKNMLIHLLNIAGLGPILGAIQGILFGPVAFILIPLGCIFMGCTHDYFSGMLSVRNKGAQITDLIKKYLGDNYYKFFIIFVSLMLLMLSAVFVFTSGDLLAERFLHQTDFSIFNPIMISVYLVIMGYYIIAALFPIDKIIGRFYPVLGFLLIFGTFLILIGFIKNGIYLENINFSRINMHPDKLPIIPMFFMTVSCGLLSGFHSTQATIISRTIKSEKDGKKIFFGMMALESVIAMIWAAAAMHVYNLNLVAENIVGTVNVINKIADTFVVPSLVCIVTFAVVVLPITSGDTALRGLRMIIGDALNLNQSQSKNRLIIMIPIALILIGMIIWAKIYNNSFSNVWKYFNFANQLITIPTFLCATVYLYQKKKNFIITLLPGLFYVFITTFFILNNKIGFNINYKISGIIALFTTIFILIFFKKHYLKGQQ